MRISFKSILIAASFFGFTSISETASAGGRTDLAHLHSGQRTSPPLGWTQFCAENQTECRPGTSAAISVVLNEKLWRELLKINHHFNQSVEPVTDQVQYGTESPRVF